MKFQQLFSWQPTNLPDVQHEWIRNNMLDNRKLKTVEKLEVEDVWTCQTSDKKMAGSTERWEKRIMESRGTYTPEI